MTWEIGGIIGGVVSVASLIFGAYAKGFKDGGRLTSQLLGEVKRLNDRVVVLETRLEERDKLASEKFNLFREESERREDQKDAENEKLREKLSKSEESALATHLVNEQLMGRLQVLTDENEEKQRRLNAIKQGRRSTDEGAGT